MQNDAFLCILFICFKMCPVTREGRVAALRPQPSWICHWEHKNECRCPSTEFEVFGRGHANFNFFEWQVPEFCHLYKIPINARSPISAWSLLNARAFLSHEQINAEILLLEVLWYVKDGVYGAVLWTEGWVDLDGWLRARMVYLPAGSHPSKY